LPKNKLKTINYRSFTFFFLVLVASLAFLTMAPSAHATQVNPQNTSSILQSSPPPTTGPQNITSTVPPETELTPQQQKGLTISKDVVGFDLTKYKVDSTIYPPDLYLGVVSQENVGYPLTSNSSNLRLMYTFTNGNLTLIHVLESETRGSPILAKPAISIVEAAKSFLSNYGIYSGNPFYSQLQSMIDLKDAALNVTTLSGNIKLKVTNTQDSTTFNWIYTNNGVDAADKCVALVYRNGFLNAFIDNWDLYNVGSATVALSESQAVGVALGAAQKFSWKVGADNDTFEVKDFNVSKVEGMVLFFGSSVMADQPRSSDRLMLYPVWRVGLLLDKVYPGGVFGIQVDIWADTKQVRSIQEQVFTMDTNNTALTANSNSSDTAGGSHHFSSNAIKPSSVPILWIATLAFGTSMAGTTLLCLRRKKYLRSFGLLRLRSFRFGLPLCILVASTMVLAPMTVNASVIPNNRATVFGAESTGQPYVGYRKTQGEILTQRIIAQNITNYFAANGYSASNYQGSNSLKPTILSVTSYNEQNYLGAAVVDFDHGVMRNDCSLAQGELHYLVEDNVGQDDSMTWVDNHQVYDVDIYNQTMGRTFFAFINTCLSADTTYNGNSSTGNPRGMPYAWTHRLVADSSPPNVIDPNFNMSDNGYARSDNGLFSYIGFPYGSAALNQTVPNPDNPDGLSYSYFVDRFFYYALTIDMSVNDALDHASYICFTPNYFGTSPIHTGFTAYWPGGGVSDPYGPNSTLVVYGNGNIHLYEHKPVATYFMNEGTGTTVHDSSGNSNTGTVYNSANWTTGHENSALSFDGVSNYVEIPNSNSLNMNNQISIAAWVNLQADHNSSINTMIRKDGTYALELGDAGNNKPAFLIYFTDGTGYRLDGPEIPKYQWHHWAGTYDWNYMRIYIDSVQVASGPVSKTIASNTNPVRIARINTNLGTEWFKGILDELFFYNYSLTQKEISRLASWSGPSSQSSYSLHRVKGGFGSGNGCGVSLR
jgi:hypothetical protein